MNVDSKKTIKNQKWLDEHSERKNITNKDHLKLNAYYIKGKGHTYILMVHGYMGSASTLINPMKNFMKRKYHLFIVDLRGHGLSEGNYVGMGWSDRNDIIEWIDYIISMDSQANIVLYGESMGASTVLNVAGENPKHVIAVIEDCGFTSVWDIFSSQIEEYKRYKYLLLYSTTFITYLRTGYNLKEASSLKQVEKTKIPILYIHGENDDIVPLSMMYELYNHTTSYKELLVIKKAGHANSYVVDPDSYYNKIEEFLNKVYPKT
jgi:fermentation-respiration switch protein FrsA (DUF1100 family)